MAYILPEFRSSSELKDAVRDLPSNVFLHVFKPEGTNKSYGLVFSKKEHARDPEVPALFLVSNIHYSGMNELGAKSTSVTPARNDNNGYFVNIKRRRYPDVIGEISGLDIAMRVPNPQGQILPGQI